MTPMADEPDRLIGPSLERRLATILSADVAEYSRLMAEDEEQTLRTFRAHKEVFESLVSLHRGRIFNTAGDAILAEFSSAVEAVRCATEIQAALRTWNDQLPPARQVRFRIGVNLGDVMVQHTDLLGDGVNVAARLQAVAEPGGICISGSVYDQIRNKLSLSFTSLGEQFFKNIPQPVRTFSISEAEGLGALPTSNVRRRLRKGAWGWAGAVVVALALGGGYWAYSQKHQELAEQGRIEAEAAKQEAARREKELIAAKQAAEEAQGRADVARQQEEAERKRAETETRRLAEEQRKLDQVARQAAARARQEASGAPGTPGAVGSIDGVYAGRVCYGPSVNDSARCYQAQATLREGKIAGQWHGRDPGVTVKLAGEVSAIGDVKIALHAERADGSQLGQANLSGTVQNGRLEASGVFFSGRTVSLSWRRN
jgi:class 3 adenylate cyclase